MDIRYPIYVRIDSINNIPIQHMETHEQIQKQYSIKL
jgi:hypothetical protein